MPSNERATAESCGRVLFARVMIPKSRRPASVAGIGRRLRHRGATPWRRVPNTVILSTCVARLSTAPYCMRYCFSSQSGTVNCFSRIPVLYCSCNCMHSQSSSSGVKVQEFRYVCECFMERQFSGVSHTIMLCHTAQRVRRLGASILYLAGIRTICSLHNVGYVLYEMRVMIMLVRFIAERSLSDPRAETFVILELPPFPGELPLGTDRDWRSPRCSGAGPCAI